tara:strand:+ start:34 stop:243 length:210 start_codon:yes stop_codon:yes gene_type:complete
MKGTMIALRKAQKEVKELREECEALQEHRAYAQKLHKQLVRATEWAYKHCGYMQKQMEDFDNHVWGDEE